MIQKTLTLILIGFTYSILVAQIFSEKDIEIFDSKFQLAFKENLTEKPICDVIAEIGKSFIGTNYLAHSLEAEGDEQLVINLTGLDCNTFLENSLVLASTKHRIIMNCPERISI